MSEKIVSESIVIDQPRQVVWQYVTTPKNWNNWYPGDLVDVTPGWQEGATLVFRSGEKPTIKECVPPELLRYGKGTFVRFTDIDSSSMLFEWGTVLEGMFAEDPLLLADFQKSFADEVKGMLEKLKILLET